MSLKASLGGFANHAAFFVRKGSIDVQLEWLGIGAVAAHEIDPLHQVGNKRDIAAEPVYPPTGFPCIRARHAI
jgi:hypothetical protein